MLWLFPVIASVFSRILYCDTFRRAVGRKEDYTQGAFSITADLFIYHTEPSGIYRIDLAVPFLPCM